MKPEEITEQLERAKDTVFLDSIRAEGEDNRSFLFQEPVDVLVVNSPGQVAGFFNGIEHALSRGMHVAGWLSYELGYLFHRPLVHLLEKRMPDIPLAWMGVYKNRIEIPPASSAHEMNTDQKGPFPSGVKVRLEVSREKFQADIARIHEHIRRGETYQVNYTVRGHFDCPGPAHQLYLALRKRQAVNYGGFIRTGDLEILCLSPELFFRKRGRRIWSRPMKGTVKRGKGQDEDARLAAFLERDEKNRAENVMIVDLIRNDLGMICETGTVTVPELFRVERYQTLFQMISRVEGRTRNTFSWQECFSALFPCGSVTGAPKIKTMEIIAELEQSPRGVYTGSIGFISPSGEACFNVAIRTMLLRSGRGELGIGSGVTIYSDPESEFSETLLKARFLSKDISYK